MSEVAVKFAFELVLPDGVDGIRLVFGVDEAGAIVAVAYVVNSWSFDFVFEASVLVEMMVCCFCCIGG